MVPTSSRERATTPIGVTRLRALKRHKGRVQIMGIVNRTPDSFFDGGTYLDDNAARAHVIRLVKDGADIVDVGAESTRPGSAAVSASDQIDRIGDAIGWVVDAGATACVDTTLPDVAAFAVGQGATMINSVALEPAGDLAEVAARAGADLVLTHCRGSMTTMRGFSDYDEDGYADVVEEVLAEWCAARDVAVDRGLSPGAILFDPGLGFQKSAVQSLTLCARLREIKERLGRHRVLVGPSRKSYLAKTVTAVLRDQADAPDDVAAPPPGERLGATIAATLDLVARGADVVRIHDVAPIRQALAYATAMTSLDAHAAAASPSYRGAGGGDGA
ncbi:MAG TPA: dihydropteroate synthase [Polyangiaceae bacterium]|nr:dihydropteroate synthase [Polyangiaceae bacterium]